jgi:flagellar hook-associated protein 3 FlgL
MAIRINPNMIPDMLAALQQDQQNQSTAIQQLSTGRRVNTPSDDPAATASYIGSQAQTGRDDQFLRNVGGLQARFQTADSALSSVVSVLTRAISLGVEGANGTMSPQDQQAIGAEVQGLFNQALSLANLTFQGTYLFSGTATTTQPFVANGASASGVTYQGDAGVASVEISTGQKVQTNVPGSQLFLNGSGSVFTALNDLHTALMNGTGISAAVDEVSKALATVSTQRVTYGNGLNQLQLTENYLNQEKVNLSQQQNKLVGADMAAVVTNLSQSQTAMQAVMSATGRVLGLPTLLDFLK